MGSITCTEVKCITIIAQRPGREKWKHTVIRLLYYTWNSKIFFKVNCYNLKVYTINPKVPNKITQELQIINQQRRWYGVT